jgi:hypothetical protein
VKILQQRSVPQLKPRNLGVSGLTLAANSVALVEDDDVGSEREARSANAETSQGDRTGSTSRREFVRKAAYVAPAILTLKSAPAYAKAGSVKSRPGRRISSSGASARVESAPVDTDRSDTRTPNAQVGAGTTQDNRGNQTSSPGHAGAPSGGGAIGSPAGHRDGRSATYEELTNPREALDSRGRARMDVRPARRPG